MAKDPDLEKFIAMKEDVLNNLATVQITIEECTEDGMPDPGNALYNQIIDVISQAQLAQQAAELELAIIKGKDIENIVDGWLAEQGSSSFELTWPDISSL